MTQLSKSIFDTQLKAVLLLLDRDQAEEHEHVVHAAKEG